MAVRGEEGAGVGLEVGSGEGGKLHPKSETQWWTLGNIASSGKQASTVSTVLVE